MFQTTNQSSVLAITRAATFGHTGIARTCRWAVEPNSDEKSMHGTTFQGNPVGFYHPKKNKMKHR